MKSRAILGVMVEKRNGGGDRMELRNDRELANTREKLRLLEDSYDEVCRETSDDGDLREAEMESLARFIKQLKEEIARYEARQAVRR
jgi:flagellar biosynthesis chaperone FliJ